MSTVLAFRTTPGAVTVPPGTTKELGVVDVSKFEKIRVIADERAGSGTGVTIRLTITEAGNEWVAQLDTLTLAPHATINRVYDVPGKALTILADATAGSGSDAVDLLIYGYQD